jgi:hypothetical protein
MVSYSGIRGYGSGKVTLPSTDTWGSDMNIIKDPPKSISTRRINKVSDTSSITTMIDESTDRACEAINLYARGVNPMVSVSYSNDNAGMNGNVTNNSASAQAYLPYRIMDRGAFRPPILTQTDLLPLSRLPRNVTSMQTQPAFIDFSKKLECPRDKMRQVKIDMLKVFSNPTAVYTTGGELSAKETYDVKNTIQNPIKVKANSGVRTLDINRQYTGVPTKELSNKVNYSVKINTGTNNNIKYGINKINTDRYTQDILAGDIKTNQIGKSNQPLDEMIDLDYNNFTNKNMLQGNLHTNNNQNIQVKSLDEMVDLDYNNFTYGELLQGNIRTNNTQNIQVKTLDEMADINGANFTNEVLQGNRRTNNTQNIQVKRLDEMADINGANFTNEVLQGNRRTNNTQNIQVKRLDEMADVQINNYTQDILHGHSHTNKNQNIQSKSLNEISNINGDNFTHHRNNITYNTTKSGIEKQNYIHNDLQLKKVLPSHEIFTAKTDSKIFKIISPENSYQLKNNKPNVSILNNNNKSVHDKKDIEIKRNVNLQPKIKIEGFISSKPQYKEINKLNNIKDNTYISEKAKFNKKIYDSFRGKYEDKLVFVE